MRQDLIRGIQSVRGFGLLTLGLYRRTCELADRLVAEAEPIEGFRPGGDNTPAGQPEPARLHESLRRLHEAWGEVSVALPRFGPTLTAVHSVHAPICAHGPITGASWHEVIVRAAEYLLDAWRASAAGVTVTAAMRVAMDRRAAALMPLGDGLRVRLVREVFAAIPSAGEGSGAAEFFEPVPAVRPRCTGGVLLAEASRRTGSAVSTSTLHKVVGEAGLEPAGPVIERPLSTRDLRLMLDACRRASARSHAVKRLGETIDALIGERSPASGEATVEAVAGRVAPALAPRMAG